MKHLKHFNESTSNYDLLEFCEMSLAYLIDEGYSINITDVAARDTYGKLNNFTKITLRVPINGNFYANYAYWDDIKDYYIPFVQLISKEYVLYRDEVTLFNRGNRGFSLKLKSLFDDNFETEMGKAFCYNPKFDSQKSSLMLDRVMIRIPQDNKGLPIKNK